MKKSDILSRVSQLQSSLVTSLQSTKKQGILDEISARIGSLSTPSKMPGYSWSIPTKYCQVGSLLAKVAGSPCSMCYASKGRYVFPNVQAAQQKRLDGWKTDEDWAALMSIRLLLLDEKHFRWFDSGDLQGKTMLLDINTVALNTPTTLHWLPTQERATVAATAADAVNLNIRISSTGVGRIQTTGLDATNSLVCRPTDELNEDIHRCPSRNQGNKCGACRACWNKEVSHVAYPLH